MKKKQILSWVTLVEVLFSIIIFGTWILVILTMLTSNVSWIYDIRNRDTALAIAKEWMDIVYHIRDSNLERWQLRNCADLQPECNQLFFTWSTAQFLLDFDPSWMYSLIPLDSIDDARIYYHTWIIWTWAIETFWYNHDPVWGEETIFSRIIEFDTVDWFSSDSSSVLRLAVRVLYGTPSRPQEITLESVIGNIR